MFNSFIESPVFPVAHISAECYKERKAVRSQTLTGLGKWWGRKPLIIIRALLLGHLMPASNNPEQDMDTFLRVLTMDEEALKMRQKKKTDWRTMLGKSYAEKIKNAKRPEEIDGPSKESWEVINSRLGTKAGNLVELFQELSIKRFGEVARIGDCFCGGGSTPFETARMGLNAYASDLNPIACLLTWGALNIIGGGEKKVAEVKAEQNYVYKEVEKQIAEWGIEKSVEGWQSEYYIYCIEVKFPDGWMVPLAPSWVIGLKTKTYAKLIPDTKKKRFNFEIISNATDAELEAAETGTVGDNGTLTNPYNGSTVKLSTLRGDHNVVTGKNDKGKDIKESRNKLRLWENSDIVHRPDDVFQERLYCIRWRQNDGTQKYRAPDAHDIKMELKALNLLQDCFASWQKEGHIPSNFIEAGFNTSQPIWERGWTHWHHLFNPRQLLTLGKAVERSTGDTIINWLQILNYSSKLCLWSSATIHELSIRVFSNQALNTVYNYATRAWHQNKEQVITNTKSGSRPEIS